VQIAYVAKLAIIYGVIFLVITTKSDMHNWLNCTLFYVFNFVKSIKVS